MKHLLTTAAAVLMLGSVAAHAGPANQSFDGFYVGGDIGGTVSSTKVNSSDKIAGDGVLGGLFAGYGLTYNSLYFGAEANGSLSSLKSTLAGTDLTRKYGFGIAGRAGYVFNPTTMAYGVVGWERGRFEVKDAVSKDSAWLDGLRLGIGLEHKLTQNISLRGEFDYIKWQEKDGIRPNEYTLKAGVSYRF